MSHSLFKLAYTKGLKRELQAPLPIFPTGIDNANNGEKEYFLRLYSTKTLREERYKLVDNKGQTYEERLLKDASHMGSCKGGKPW